MASYGLSKSRIIAWKQCPKRLWLQLHRRELLEVTDAAERGFQIGFEVGEVADRLYLLVEGVVSLPEVGRTLSAGRIFGEIAFFAPERRRMNYFGQPYCLECQKSGRDNVLRLDATGSGMVCSSGHRSAQG